MRAFLRHLWVSAQQLVARKSKPTPTASMRLGSDTAPLRLCVVANAMIPTVQLSIVLPLQNQIASGHCAIEFLTEQQLKSQFGKQIRSEDAWRSVEHQVRLFRPTHLVFCRYSGPHVERLLQFARDNRIPTIFCIDDDLLNVPKELGEKKFAYHNHPLRLQAIRLLLSDANVVYCSNGRLAERFRALPMSGTLVASEIFCAVDLVASASLRPVRKIGYMGFDHAHDFEIALPAIVKLLTDQPNITFELFGKIPKPTELDQFGSRIVQVPPVESYDAFLRALAARQWDIGIAPLAATPFNHVKNINKWIEYTAAGVAVVASKGRIYDECCLDECGVLCSDSEWYDALDTLVQSPERRLELVLNAQRRLQNDYSVKRLTEQFLSVLKVSNSVGK